MHPINMMKSIQLLAIHVWNSLTGSL